MLNAINRRIKKNAINGTFIYGSPIIQVYYPALIRNNVGTMLNCLEITMFSESTHGGRAV